MSTAGHQWVGEQVRGEIPAEKVNVDADPLSRLPMDMDSYVDSCTEELSRDTILAAWEGSRAAKQQDVAYVAALNLSQIPDSQSPELLPTISHDKREVSVR